MPNTISHENEQTAHFLASEYPQAPRETALFHVIPAPLEATVSYGGGTARGPAAILTASDQLERFDGVSQPGDAGIHTYSPVSCQGASEQVLPRIRDAVRLALRAGNREADDADETYGAGHGASHGASRGTGHGASRGTGHGASHGTGHGASHGTGHGAGRRAATDLPVPVVLGGEHAVTAPAVEAVRDELRELTGLKEPLGVVQIDAHADLRDQYEGSPWSHACVVRRIHQDLKVPVIQLGVRAISTEESEYRASAAAAGGEAAAGDETGSAGGRAGGPAGYPAGGPLLIWHDAQEIVPSGVTRIPFPERFPPFVYLTVDVDGLDPSVCPATGTPVPGGLPWYQALGLLEWITSCRPVAAFDVVELAPVPGLHAADYAVAELTYRIMGMITRSRAGIRPEHGAPAEAGHGR